MSEALPGARAVDVYQGEGIRLSDSELTAMRRAFLEQDLRIVLLVAEVQARRAGSELRGEPLEDGELTRLAKDYLFFPYLRSVISEARRARLASQSPLKRSAVY